jgi:hypothetical protein
MRPKLLLAATLGCLAALLIAPSTTLAREPANQNDPCSSAGRNTCGTNGVGQYKNYRYGIRWFGDFRGAVPDVGPTFCIDLRWWYPARRYNFREVSSENLRNTNGGAISAAKQGQMAYALWNYGRSGNANQQSAVMLYVHSLMGDGAPGEVDPAAINPQVVALYRRIQRDARRFRGPYRIQSTVPGGLAVGVANSATIRVLSATGTPVPNVDVTLTTQGASGVPARITTNGAGVARIRFTPTDVAGFEVSMRTEAMASNLPRIFKATTQGAGANGQRMAAADSQRVTAGIAAPVAQGSVRISTEATPAELLLTQPSADKVTIKGAPTGWNRTIQVNVYGPFPTAAAIRCDTTPVNQSSFVANGSGVYTTQPFTPTAPGWYAYQLVVPGDANVAGVTTPCAEPKESFRVQVQPRLRTIVSSGALRPDQTVFDRVIVEGLGGQSVVVQAALYGPFGSREAIKCDTTPVWTGSVNATADGEYKTDPVALRAPGYYTYRETIAGSELVKASETTCADVAETTVVIGTPQVRTQASTAETSPGSQITDQVVVTGLGVVTATVQVELWGPYNSTAAISCSGTPYATQALTVNGDGTYTTQPFTIDRAGYYTFRESLAGGPANEPQSAACGEASETTFARPAPVVTTVASAEVVRPGSELSDLVKVTGLGKTPATVDVSLYGPFTSRGAIRCTGTPVGTVRVDVAGDGEYRSPSIRVPKAGMYTFREKLLASGLVPEVIGRCAVESETALVAPLILTGKGDPAPTGARRTLGTPRSAPTRVRIEALGINALARPVGIDVEKGILDVPIDIQRLGWWRDGQAPGATRGAVLIAGHVDSARRGGGAFVNLKNARAGQPIRVTTADGRVRTYRVATVRRYLKSALPTSVYSSRGRARLVLVTCGGPFLREQGAYRDNVVVTAFPA